MLTALKFMLTFFVIMVLSSVIEKTLRNDCRKETRHLYNVALIALMLSMLGCLVSVFAIIWVI